MAVEQHRDAEFINSVVNDPSVLPWVQGNLEGPLDVAPLLRIPGNVLLCDEYGGVLFIEHQPGFYEAHTQVLPAGRGKWAVQMVREALQWMFTKTSAVDIQTKCPQGNIGALALAKRIGGRELFIAERGWTYEGKIIPAAIYGLSIQDWLSSAPGLEERGKWFHDRLESEYARHGVGDPTPHPDDLVHDRYVGAAVEMIAGGQPHKAAVFYNRWAVMAGYAPISIIKASPPTVTVDIDDAILIVRPDGDFWVASCRRA